MVLHLLLAWASAAYATPADDLVALEALVDGLHPHPYRYTPEADVRAAFAAERATLGDDATELEIAAAMHRVLALLGDAHVAIGLPMMQPGSTTPVALLPVLPRRVEGRVLLDAFPVDLPAGTEILAVDGRPIGEIYATASALVAADGRDPDATLRALEWDLPRFYALAYGMHDEHDVRVRRPDGTEETLTVAAVNRDGMRALRTSRRVPAWWGTPTADSLPALDGAVLHVPTFGVPDSDAFQARVDEAFTAIDPDAPLVIDLRGNEGGLRPNAIKILDHLVAEPYVEWTSMRVARTRVPKRLGRDLQWPYGNAREVLQPFGSDRVIEGDPLSDTTHPGDVHRGSVTVLVDARTGSAANGFVLVLEKYRPDVRVVGEPLGGSCDRHIGELPTVWTGPETGMFVMFSLIEATHVEVARCVPGRGLTPDVAVAPTVADFVDGIDPWLR